MGSLISTAQVQEWITRLSKAEFNWSNSDQSGQILGLTLLERVGGGSTFIAPDGVLVDFYAYAGSLTAIELVIDSAEADGLPETDYEDVVDAYYAKFKNTVRLTVEVLGAPAFCDGMAAPGFPADQDSVWLALWPLTRARLMIQQKHEGREIPFRLSIVAAPP